jgi:hypothetical protein
VDLPDVHRGRLQLDVVTVCGVGDKRHDGFVTRDVLGDDGQYRRHVAGGEVLVAHAKKLSAWR